MLKTYELEDKINTYALMSWQDDSVFSWKPIDVNSYLFEKFGLVIALYIKDTKCTKHYISAELRGTKDIDEKILKELMGRKMRVEIDTTIGRTIYEFSKPSVSILNPVNDGFVLFRGYGAQIVMKADEKCKHFAYSLETVPKEPDKSPYLDLDVGTDEPYAESVGDMERDSLEA